ncbi:TPA: ead/Ea22-like family protein [Escherichia coli]|nr:ead/Ea22-like family protein [Escherichia coli]HCI0130437.1 ead/Ea22-like family protein [Escherichia coli]HCI8467348.1 ead/Ea22-like family protein [Escherichia coli]
MNKIDYQALREKAEKATCGEWSLEYGEERFDAGDALIHREVVGYLPICRIEGAHPESGFDEDFQMEQQANAEFIAAFNPKVALALLDERERNQQYIKSRDQENKDIALTVGKLRVELEAVQKTLAARIEAIDRTHKMFQREKDRADAAEKCIAELSASHSKLRDTMAGIHNTIRMDGGYTPLAAILNAAKRAYEESASAAGIRIKGE